MWVQSVFSPHTAGGFEAEIGGTLKLLELETTALGKEKAGAEASTPENLGEHNKVLCFNS